MGYERALALSPRNGSALNNRAVVVLSGAQEDWFTVNQAAALLQDAIRADASLLSARINLALIYNYYRIFGRAKPLWEQAVGRSPDEDVREGLAIALQGTGSFKAAEVEFGKLSPASADRFGVVFHDAARLSLQGPAGAERCGERLGALEESGLAPFEKDSVIHLKRVCEAWKLSK
jgi:Flp pilus assembly protein TadD